MAAITNPLAVAAIVFFLCAAATRIFQPAGGEAEEMDARMAIRLILGPACLAVIILILSGTADHLYLVR